MKSLIIFSSLYILILIVFPVQNRAAMVDPVSDTVRTCLVTGEQVSGSGIKYRYIDTDIQFCSEGCVMAFEKEPAKYIGNGLKCIPCNDDDGKRDISYMHNGVKYYFCGKGCKAKFESDAQKYLDKTKEN